MLLFNEAEAIPPFLKRGLGGLEHVSLTSKANPPNLSRSLGTPRRSVRANIVVQNF